LKDIDLGTELIHILPNTVRRLKTKNSQRTLPLVGYSKLAMEQALRHSDGEYLFPRYIRNGYCKTDHASATLGKWLKNDFDRLTEHCLRHTFRDRLGAVECPMDMIDQIGGWKSVSLIGCNYGQGYSLEQIRRCLKAVQVR
jgi:integrase